MSRFSRIVRRIPAWLAVAVLVGGVGAAWAQTPPATGASPDVSARAPATMEADKKVAEAPEMSVLDLFVKGGVFMIPIVLASMLGVAIIVERLLALRRKTIIPPGFMAGLKAALREGQDDPPGGLGYCQAHDCPMARVVSAGINKLPAGEAAVEEAVEDAGANEVSKLRRNLRLLFGVAAVSPMLGLLGSVSGMIRSFRVASLHGVGKGELLAKGIYEALVSTYGGLLVAIPTLIFYYAFLNKIDRIVTEMNDASREFLDQCRAPRKA